MIARFKGIVSVSALASEAGCDRQTVYNAVERGEIEPIAEGRPVVFTPQEARRWMKWYKGQVRPGPRGPRK